MMKFIELYKNLDTSNDDTKIDIEVQISEVKVWAERSLFYLAKMYADQIQPGENTMYGMNYEYD